MSGFDFKIYANDADVPTPSNGRVIAFVGANGIIKTKNSLGQVVDLDLRVATAQAMAGSALSAATQAATVAAAAGVKADLSVTSINVARVGVVAGLDVLNVLKDIDLRGRILRFKGSLLLVSSATGAVSIGAVVAGYTLIFPSLNVAIATQYFDFEVDVHIDASNTLNATSKAIIKQSIALNGTNAAPSHANNTSVSGAYANNNCQVIFKSPVTTQVTTRFAMLEVL